MALNVILQATFNISSSTLIFLWAIGKINNLKIDCYTFRVCHSLIRQPPVLVCLCLSFRSDDFFRAGLEPLVTFWRKISLFNILQWWSQRRFPWGHRWADGYERGHHQTLDDRRSPQPPRRWPRWQHFFTLNQKSIRKWNCQLSWVLSTLLELINLEFCLTGNQNIILKRI